MSVLSAIRLSKAPAAAFAVVGTFWGSFAAQAPVLKAQLGADDALFGTLLLGTSLGLVTTMLLAPLLDRKLGQWALPVGACVMAGAVLVPPGGPIQPEPVGGVTHAPFRGMTSAGVAGLANWTER